MSMQRLVTLLVWGSLPAIVHAEISGVDLAALTGWEIVVGARATPAEKHAAQEFKDFFKQASNQDLPIVAVATQRQGRVLIGPDAVSESASHIDAGKYSGPEDFQIIIRDHTIAIAGGRPRGTLYGVYTFLEDYMGVRFLTVDQTWVPPLGGWRVVGPVDRVYHPPLAFRHAYYRENSAEPAFATRLRNNTITDDPRYGGKTGIQLINHSLGRYLPTSKYGKEHPEYFALVDGKRLSDVKNDWSETQPCLTNPDVLRIVTAGVLEDLKSNPRLENISVSQNDNAQYCRCPRCAEIDKREDSPMGSLLTFVNAVADEVAKEHPRVMVGTLSYWYSRKPPRTVRPGPNVQIQLCSIECCQLHAIDDPACTKNQAFCHDTDGWGHICSNISIWNYDVNFHAYQLPLPNLPIIEPNVRYFVAHHAHGVFMQASGDTLGSAFCDLHNYVISNMLWDPNRSADRLRDEFLRLHYGKAAPPIRGLIEQIEVRARATGHHPDCFGQPQFFGFDDALAQTALAAFADASQLARDDAAIAKRVEKASVTAYRLALNPCFRMKETEVIDPALAERMRPFAKKFFELCHKYQIAYVQEGHSVEEAQTRLRKVLWKDQNPDF